MDRMGMIIDPHNMVRHQTIIIGALEHRTNREMVTEATKGVIYMEEVTSITIPTIGVDSIMTRIHMVISRIRVTHMEHPIGEACVNHIGVPCKLNIGTRRNLHI